jgi:very-short-patch-repair endonuclease
MPPLKIRVIRKIHLAKSVVRFVKAWISSGKIPDWQYMKTQSDIERKLYLALKEAGYRVRTQFPLGAYRCDLAIPKHRVVIECDGEAYHSNPEQKERDLTKTRIIKKVYGWKVIRFKDSEIVKNVDKCVEKVHKTTGKKKGFRS